MGIPHYAYSVIRLTFELFLHFGYCEQCYYEHCPAIICLSVCFQILGYIPRSGIAGSYGNSLCIFLWDSWNVFLNSYNNLQSYQQCMKDLISPHPHQHLLFSICVCVCVLFSILKNYFDCHSRECQWYLIMVLTCISLMANHVEHLILVGHFNIFFGEMSIKVLCPF